MSDAPSPEVSFQTVKSLALGLTSEPDYLIEGLIEKGDQVLLYGQPKVGKTFLAIQMACALACQKPFLSWEIKERRKVLYINFEMGERVFSDRISKFLDQPTSDFSPAERVAFFDAQITDFLAFTVRPRSVDILERNGSLKKLISGEKPDFIVFDTLAKLHSVNESENNAIQRVLTGIRNICELNGDPITHMIVHHARKASINMPDNGPMLSPAEIRGGSAIRGEADVILGLSNDPGGAGGGAKMTLIMEARNIELENLDLVKNGVIFQRAPTQTSVLLKDDFYKKLRAAGQCSKSDLVSELVKQHGVENDTVTKSIQKWKKEDRSIREKRDPKDKRKRIIWIEKIK